MAKSVTANVAPTAKERAKRICPITRQEFRDHGPQALTITVEGIAASATRKEFSTGSLGWNLNGKTTVTIAGKPVDVQIGMNMTIIGSKELPQTEAPAAE